MKHERRLPADNPQPAIDRASARPFVTLAEAVERILADMTVTIVRRDAIGETPDERDRLPE